MSNPHVRVSIIILNWNGKAHLSVCLESLSVQTFKEFEVVLVDNGSTDGSLEIVKSGFPWIKVISLPDNRGFAGGNNTGLTHAIGSCYVVTLNNDTMAEPTWLEELVRVADAHPKVGMVASRICSYDDHDVIDSLGVKVCRDGMSRGAYRLLRFSEQSLEKTEEILMPSACAALYRRKMIDLIGFFDEDFFAYCEDTDLGLRARLAGWEALLARDAVVYHKYSQTGGVFSPFKLYLVERNHYLVAIKTYPMIWLMTLPFATCWRYIEQARLVFTARGAGNQFLSSGSQGECLVAILKGIWDALGMCSKFWRKRMAFEAYRRLDDKDMLQLLNRYKLTFRELLDAG